MATGEDASTVDQGAAPAVEATERVPSVVRAPIHWVPTQAETAALALMAKEEAAVVPPIIRDRDTHTFARWLTRKGGGVDDYIVEFIHLRTATGGEALTNSATASDRLHPVVTDPDQPPNTLPYDIRREMEMPPHLIYLLTQPCGRADWAAHPPAHERWSVVREKRGEGVQFISATYRQRIAPSQARSDKGEKGGVDVRTEGGEDESNVLGTGGMGDHPPVKGRSYPSTKERAGEAYGKAASEQGRNTARLTRYINRPEEIKAEGAITESTTIAVAKISHNDAMPTICGWAGIPTRPGEDPGQRPGRSRDKTSHQECFEHLPSLNLDPVNKKAGEERQLTNPLTPNTEATGGDEDAHPEADWPTSGTAATYAFGLIIAAERGQGPYELTSWYRGAKAEAPGTDRWTLAWRLNEEWGARFLDLMQAWGGPEKGEEDPQELAYPVPEWAMKRKWVCHWITDRRGGPPAEPARRIATSLPAASATQANASIIAVKERSIAKDPCPTLAQRKAQGHKRGKSCLGGTSIGTGGAPLKVQGAPPATRPAAGPLPPPATRRKMETDIATAEVESARHSAGEELRAQEINGMGTLAREEAPTSQSLDGGGTTGSIDTMQARAEAGDENMEGSHSDGEASPGVRLPRGMGRREEPGRSHSEGAGVGTIPTPAKGLLEQLKRRKDFIEPVVLIGTRAGDGSKKMHMAPTSDTASSLLTRGRGSTPPMALEPIEEEEKEGSEEEDKAAAKEKKKREDLRKQVRSRPERYVRRDGALTGREQEILKQHLWDGAGLFGQLIPHTPQPHPDRRWIEARWRTAEETTKVKPLSILSLNAEEGRMRWNVEGCHRAVTARYAEMQAERRQYLAEIWRGLGVEAAFGASCWRASEKERKRDNKVPIDPSRGKESAVAQFGETKTGVRGLMYTVKYIPMELCEEKHQWRQVPLEEEDDVNRPPGQGDDTGDDSRDSGPREDDEYRGTRDCTGNQQRRSRPTAATTVTQTPPPRTPDPKRGDRRG
eukprot:GHVU01145600.1.p1 GENE.GHVU01145600.1~~GHVU01145600.1.p1  ORF type:complete len:1037 (+),score=160.35 GHVU01145600.1:97-3111(+)